MLEGTAMHWTRRRCKSSYITSRTWFCSAVRTVRRCAYQSVDDLRSSECYWINQKRPIMKETVCLFHTNGLWLSWALVRVPLFFHVSFFRWLFFLDHTWLQTINVTMYICSSFRGVPISVWYIVAVRELVFLVICDPRRWFRGIWIHDASFQLLMPMYFSRHHTCFHLAENLFHLTVLYIHD